MWKSIVLCLVLVIGVPAESTAERLHAKIEIEIYVGVFKPLKPLGGNNFGVTAEENEDDIAGGARLYIPVFPYMSIESTLLFSPSGLVANSGTSSNIWAGSVRLAVHNSSSRRAARYGLNAGVIMTGAGGDVSRDRKRTGWGGVVGGTLVLPIGNYNSLRFDIEEYFYKRGWEENIGLEIDNDLLRDLVLSVGLVFPLNL